MHVLQILLLVAGIGLLVVGYRRTQRNLMLAAALLLFASGSVEPFMRGFVEGYADAAGAHSRQG